MAEEMENINPLDECISKQIEIITQIQTKGGDASKEVGVLDTLYKLKLKESEINIDWNRAVLSDDNEKEKINIDKDRLELDKDKLELDKERLKQQRRESRNNLIISGASIGSNLLMDNINLQLEDVWLQKTFDFERDNYLGTDCSKSIVRKVFDNMFRRRK